MPWINLIILATQKSNTSAQSCLVVNPVIP